MRQLIRCLVIAMVACWSIPMRNTAHAGSPQDDDRPPAWHFSADKIDYDQERDEYVARGNASIMRKGNTLTADRVRFSQGSKEAVAEGNVRLVYGDSILSGRRLEINLETETGTLTDGTVFISPNHLYLSGERIRKTGAQTFALEKARITSCDGPDPDWQVTGNDLEVTIEGYGFAKHTTLWAGKVPVFYSPYLVFPVKLKRQTGLLIPEFGFSDRKGSEFTQPFFWAISDSSDATVYAHGMSERGVRAGVEFRYIIDAQARGTLYAEGLDDQRIDDGDGDSSELWGYADDANVRTNEGRYWLRMKHDQEVGLGLAAKLDIDWVSDQDYLREFKSSAYGFDETQSHFEKTYGREIDDYTDAVRLNRLNLNRTWSSYSFNADLRWYDDVVKRNENEADDTLQQLPTVALNGVRQALGDSPVDFDLAARYDHFYRIDGTRGQRVDLYPRLYYPLDLLDAISVEPSAGVRQTAWRVDRDDGEPGDGGEDPYRSIYDFKVDISSELFRIYQIDRAGRDRLKHSIVPELTYAYVPDQDQSDYPEFDVLDRIERKNAVTYAITNTLIARAPSRTAEADRAYAYTSFLRFKLEQSFDIDKHNENDPEPFSDISAELDITPGRHVALDADAQWSVYDHRIESLNNALKLWNTGGDRLTVDYRYTRESSEGQDDGIHAIRAEGVLSAAERWEVSVGHEHNLYDDQAIESRIGIRYQSQCWGLDFEYALEHNEEKNNHKFTIQFDLLHLGSLGT